MYKFVLFAFISLFAANLKAQQYWTNVSFLEHRPSGVRHISPSKAKIYRLSVPALQLQCEGASHRTGNEAVAPVEITVPMPDGVMQRFNIYETPVMAAELQEKYPDIRCYTGTGIDDPGARIKLDITPQGFHAMVFAGTYRGVFIDPFAAGDTEYYQVYYKKDLPEKEAFDCHVDDHESLATVADEPAMAALSLQGDCTLRTYRLALACTGEYATFHGGTKALVLAAMNTTMNRVNGVYERDLSVTMKIIPNNDTLIFLNGASDPYSNGDESTMLQENINTCNARIGLANYDIGHVFGTGGGGVAGLSVVCTNSKARGVTSLNSPVGDPFDIDYVAHEMGHQFSGRHTQNNPCNRDANASAEPGSASTIMGYAGICAPNVQSNSDDYFHAVSLQSMSLFITTGSGNNCPVKTVTGNSQPVVTNIPNYNIPRSTPFALTASATDADGDPLTYCWEQMDLDPATMPPVSTNTLGPMFRSFDPTASPTRFFPRLQDLVNNTNGTWEELPSVARTMLFRVTVRDNHPGGGCTTEDNVQLTVAGNAGPFLVTAPNTPVIWTSGEQRTVSWDVANTNIAPVNAAQVRITLSVDGGFTYPHVLATAVANTGSFVVEVPYTPSTQCRVRVEAVGNVFFDISDQNFTIVEPPVPTFFIDGPDEAGSICVGDTAVFQITSTSFAGFSDPVNLTLTGLPAGASFSITPAAITPGQSAQVTITGFTPANAGSYTLNVQGTAAAITRVLALNLTVLPGLPEAVSGLAPANGATGQSLGADLQWAAAQYAGQYTLQLSTSPAFTSLLLDTTVNAGTSYNLPVLDQGTVYYWRIRSVNSCGLSDWTAAAFQTGLGSCGLEYVSTNVPVNISTSAEVTVSSTINVPDNRSVVSVAVSMTGSHTWVGDLVARLVSPANDTVVLFDRPGEPADEFGCSNNDFNLSFDDAATNTATMLENMCNSTTPALVGTFQPVEGLSAFAGQNAQGTWRLLVSDTYAGDGGALTAWRLSFCLADSTPVGALLVNAPLTVPAGQTEEIANANLALSLTGTPAQGVFTLLSTPAHGTVTLNGAALGTGDSFTQNDLNAGAVAYQHNGGPETTDSFLFTAIDQPSSGWVQEETFFINIVQNTLVAAVAVTDSIDCNGAAGTLTVNASGLSGPYTYSLNGGAAQSSNIFSNLPAGDYTVVVTGGFGFTATAEATLSQPSPIVVSGTVTGDSITVQATGGTSPFTYSIGGNFQSNPVFADLANGPYTPIVTDANGCTQNGNTVIVAVNTLLAAVEVLEQVLCYNGENGAIEVTVGGGQTPYSYSLDGTSFQPSPTFTGLPPGDYTVLIRDAQGFEITSGPVTLANPAELAASATGTSDTITVGATGGTPPFTYSINGSAFQSSAVFPDLSNGTYTPVVMDANGCTASAPAVVIAVNTLAGTVSVLMPVLCHNGNEGSVTAVITGGQSPYTYSLNGGAFQSSPTFSGLQAGTYTITVRDAQGFELEAAPVTLSNPPLLTLTASVNQNSITANGVGGTGTLAYSLNGINYQPSPVFTGVANGNYTVIVRDANGCTATATATVNIAPLVFTAVEVQPVTCASASSVTIIVTATGGIMPYEFRIAGGAWQSSNTLVLAPLVPLVTVEVRDALGTVTAQNVSITIPAPITVAVNIHGNDVTGVSASGGSAPYQLQYNTPGGGSENIPAGSYTVLVTDANGCTTVQPFEITYIPVSLGLNFIVEPTCTNPAGEVEVEPVQGLPPFLFAVDGGTPQSSPTFTGLTPGLHLFTVVDEEQSTDTLEVLVPDVPAVSLSATVVGDTIVLIPDGGTPPFSYRIGGASFGPDSIFTGLAPGNYTLTVRDAKGCTADVQVMISSVTDIVQAWGIRVLPNPGPGRFTVEIQNVPGELYARVFDITGRMVAEPGAFTPLHHLQVDLTTLPAGMYLLQLSTREVSGVVRLEVVR